MAAKFQRDTSTTVFNHMLNKILDKCMVVLKEYRLLLFAICQKVKQCVTIPGPLDLFQQCT